MVKPVESVTIIFMTEIPEHLQKRSRDRRALIEARAPEGSFGEPFVEAPAQTGLPLDVAIFGGAIATIAKALQGGHQIPLMHEGRQIGTIVPTPNSPEA